LNKVFFCYFFALYPLSITLHAHDIWRAAILLPRSEGV
jgi:hypothetical protein